MSEGIGGRWEALVEERDELKEKLAHAGEMIKALSARLESLNSISEWGDEDLAHMVMAQKVALREAILLAEEGWSHAQVGVYFSRRVRERMDELAEVLNADATSVLLRNRKSHTPRASVS